MTPSRQCKDARTTVYNDGIRCDGCPSTPPCLLFLNDSSAKAEVEKEPKKEEKKNKKGAEKQDENDAITRRWRRGWLLQDHTG